MRKVCFFSLQLRAYSISLSKLANIFFKKIRSTQDSEIYRRAFDILQCRSTFERKERKRRDVDDNSENKRRRTHESSAHEMKFELIQNFETRKETHED
jgi:hypothetical protein